MMAGIIVDWGGADALVRPVEQSSVWDPSVLHRVCKIGKGMTSAVPFSATKAAALAAEAARPRFLI